MLRKWNSKCKTVHVQRWYSWIIYLIKTKNIFIIPHCKGDNDENIFDVSNVLPLWGNRCQCALVPNPKLMWYQQRVARFHSVPYTGRMKQFVRSQTNVPHGTTMMGGQHHRTITLFIISWAVLVRFSPNWNHCNGHEIHLMPRKARFTKWALPLTEVNAARLYQKRSWCGIKDMRRVAILYLTLSE